MSPTRLGTIMVNVRTLLRVNSKANMNSFQAKMNEKRDTATTPGAANDKEIRQNAPQREHPSSSAASSISSGRSSKKPLSSQMTKGKLKMVFATIHSKMRCAVQPLIAPAIKPFVIKRSINNPSKTTGMTAVNVSAEINHHCTPRVLFCAAMSTGMVMALKLVSIKA